MNPLVRSNVGQLRGARPCRFRRLHSGFRFPKPSTSGQLEGAELERVAIPPGTATRPIVNDSVIAVLPGVLELIQGVTDRKAPRLVTRGEFPEGLQFLCHDRLRGRHQEHALDVPFLPLAQFCVRLLEWIGAEVEDERRAQRE